MHILKEVPVRNLHLVFRLCSLGATGRRPTMPVIEFQPATEFTIFRFTI